jgi:hypothetical protein
MENLKLIVLILIISLTFPVFAMGLTQFGEAEITKYDIAVSPEALVSAGIMLGDAESHNVSYGGGFVYFTLNDSDVRIKWDDLGLDPSTLLPIGDALMVQRKSPLGRVLNSWIFPERLYIFGELTDYKSLYVYNSTIIQEWNDNYNWSMFRIPQEGLVMIIQPPPTSDNLTDAVYNDGMITITIGKSLEIDENINLRKIINWYMGLLLGDRTWGLPSFFTWVVRILTALSVLAMAVFLKEMLRL